MSALDAGYCELVRFARTFRAYGFKAPILLMRRGEGEMLVGLWPDPPPAPDNQNSRMKP